MTYVIAGLHGSLDDFCSLEKNAAMGEKDTVYILGGIVGGDLSLVTELSMRPNVYPVSDKDALDALRMLGGFTKLLAGGGTPDPSFVAEMKAWASRGGAETLEAFRGMDDDMREGILDYLGEFSLFEETTIKGREWLLLSAGVEGYTGNEDLYELDPSAFAGVGFDMNSDTFAGRTVVTARAKQGQYDKITNFRGNWCLDCGKAACLRLEDGECFYA